jgi:hypothetical protein
MKDIKFTQVVHDIVSIFLPGVYFLGTTILFLITINTENYDKLILFADKVTNYNSLLLFLILLVVSYLLGTFVYYLSKPIKKLGHTYYEKNKYASDIDCDINQKVIDKMNIDFDANLKFNPNMISYYGYGESYIINHDKDGFLQIILSKYRLTMNIITIQIINLLYIVTLLLHEYMSAKSFGIAVTIMITIVGTLWVFFSKKNPLLKDIMNDEKILLDSLQKRIISLEEDKSFKATNARVLALTPKTVLIEDKEDLTRAINQLKKERKERRISHIVKTHIWKIVMIIVHLVILILSIVFLIGPYLGYVVLLLCCYLSIWFTVIQFLNLYKICSKEITRILYFNLLDTPKNGAKEDVI